MLKQVILILICIFTVGGSGGVFAQTKITLDTKRFPKNFEGHDAAILFDGLNALLKADSEKNAAAVRENLKGKAVYKNLTTDDLFAFTLEAADDVFGIDRNNDLRYRGRVFPLRNLKDFPPPHLKYRPIVGGGTGTGSGSSRDPGFSSFEELVSKFAGRQPLETLWTSGYLPVKTVHPPEALAKKYAGSYNIFVPSPQIHYGLSFVKEQPFSLMSVADQNFSLQTYQFTRPKTAGIVAWLENGEDYVGEYERRAAAPIFIVRLVAPYLASENHETPDAAEQKPHRAVRNIIYADLAAIWIYDRQTGEIFSKSGEQVVVPTSDSNKDQTAGQKTDVRLKIIRRPSVSYTEKARQNQVNGVVKLKITFLASGQIGEIKVVEGLPDGLTEQAVKSARGIVFSPAVKNGMPVTVTKIMEFNFTIY